MAKGEKMSVRVWGNPAPFAVGTSLVSWETIALGGTLICPAHYTQYPSIAYDSIAYHSIAYPSIAYPSIAYPSIAYPSIAYPSIAYHSIIRHIIA